MKLSIYIFVAPLFLACARSPFLLDREERFYDSIFSGFSSRVVEYSNLSTDGKNLYFGTKKGRFFSVEALTEKVRWKKRLEGGVDTEPLAMGDLVYVGTSKGHFYALSKGDGKEVWHVEIPGEVVGRIGGQDNEAVLFGANDGVVYAFDPRTGDQRFKYRRDLPERMTIHGFAQPVFTKTFIFTAFGDGSVIALYKNSGQEVWSKNFPSGKRFSDIVSLMVIADEIIVAGQFDGTLYGLTLDGALRWSYPMGGSAGQPFVFQGQLIVPSANNVLASLDYKTGMENWVYDPRRLVRWSGVAGINQYLLGTTFEGLMFIVDSKSGQLQWTYDFGSSIQGPPLVIDQKVWLLTREGKLFGLTPRQKERGDLKVVSSVSLY